MDARLNTEYFELNEKIIQDVKKQYNLDKDEDLNQVINLIEEWIEKQPHFKKKKFPRSYLENSLIAAKGSIERTKIHLEKLSTLKTVCPLFFQECDFKNLYVYWKDYYIHSMLPKLTDNNHRIYLSKWLKDGINSCRILNLYRTGIMLCEYLKMYDCNDGLIVITDLRNVSLMDIITELNLMDLKQIMTISMEGYASRIKGIHFITSSSTVEILTKILKSVVSSKIAGRINAHKTPDTLYEFVPKEVLPVEYGGKELSLQELNDKWIDVLSKKQNIEFFKEMFAAGTDEILRPKSVHDDPCLRLVGSFRTISVD